jgi:hypothetical protein
MSWWMVAGAVISGYGAMQAGKARAAEARAEAAQLEEQKKDAKVTAMQEHNIRMQNLNVMLGVNASLAGVMGRDEDRSLAAIKQKILKEATTLEDRSRLQYLSDQNQRSMSIQIAGMRASNARRAGTISAIGSLLSAGDQYSKISGSVPTASVTGTGPLRFNPRRISGSGIFT